EIGRLAALDNSHCRALPGRLSPSILLARGVAVAAGCCGNGILRGRRRDACSGPPRPRSVLRYAERRSAAAALPSAAHMHRCACEPVPIGALALRARFASPQLCPLCDPAVATLFGAASCERHKIL